MSLVVIMPVLLQMLSQAQLDLNLPVPVLLTKAVDPAVLRSAATYEVTSKGDIRNNALVNLTDHNISNQLKEIGEKQRKGRIVVIVIPSNQKETRISTLYTSFRRISRLIPENRELQLVYLVGSDN